VSNCGCGIVNGYKKRMTLPCVPQVSSSKPHARATSWTSQASRFDVFERNSREALWKSEAPRLPVQTSTHAGTQALHPKRFAARVLRRIPLCAIFNVAGFVPHIRHP
jgi:hypothetical protein